MSDPLKALAMRNKEEQSLMQSRSGAVFPELASWIERVMKENGYSYEMIFINDGSTDNSWSVIEGLKEKNPNIHGIKFRRNYGKSPALYCGFERAKGDVVIRIF